MKRRQVEACNKHKLEMDSAVESADGQKDNLLLF